MKISMEVLSEIKVKENMSLGEPITIKVCVSMEVLSKKNKIE